MLFNSIKFLLVFPVIFIVYWAMPVRWATARKSFLLAASYALYMCFSPAFIALLMGVTLISYGGVFS